MPDVYLGRINRYIEKLFNIKGGPTVVDVSSQVSTHIELQTGVEDRYLQGWYRFIGSFAVNAVAAQFSRMQLRNPNGSRVMVVIESIFPNSGAMDWSIATTGVDLANVQAAGTFLRRLDARAGFTDSNAILSSDNSATQLLGAAGVLMRHTGTEIILYPDQQITILPGDALWIVSDAVNLAAQVYVIWRERPMESSESA